MMETAMQVDLGFTEQKVAVGTHLCLVYTDDRERIESLLRYALSGLVSNERIACFSEKMDEATLREFLASQGVSYDERKDAGAISLAGTAAVYFQDGTFNPDRMLQTLSDYYDESCNLGFSAARVIGEMTPDVEDVPGGDRLLEYECRVSMLLKMRPVTAVCQYDARAFDGATIMNILKVHPKMIVNGAVIQNPFFIEPEEFLKVL